jgi:hypothetical protein
VAFPGGAMVCSTKTSGSGQGPELGSRGFTIAPDGTQYLLSSIRGSDVHAGNWTRLTKYDSTGKMIQDSLIIGNTSTAGIQVDRSGCLYTTLSAKPKGVFYPDGFVASQFPNPLITSPKPYTIPYMFCNYYLTHYGSIFKYPPTGGSQLLVGTPLSSVPNGNLNSDTVPQLQATGLYTKAYEIKGALWQHFGVSPTTGYGEEGGDPTCVCYHPRFEVDEYGRIFMPDAMRFRVSVIDNNKNSIINFGSYGNVDQTGPGSRIPSPEIPLCLPRIVRKVNNAVYIADAANERIVKVKLDFQLWKTASGKIGSVAENGAGAKSHSFTVSPAPFNLAAKISFFAPTHGLVSLQVVDMLGKVVRTLHYGELKAGPALYSWDTRDNNGREVAAGTYSFVLNMNGKRLIKRAVFLK